MGADGKPAIAALIASLIAWRRPDQLEHSGKANHTDRAPQKASRDFRFENLSPDPDNAYFADGIKRRSYTPG
jgi:hypothetical protein